MMISVPALVALLLLLLALGWMTVRDKADYARFREARDSAQRRGFFARWIATSWLVFGAGGIGILAALGATDALTRFPADFAALDLRPANAPSPSLSNDWETLAGMAAGLVVGATIAAFVWKTRIEKMRAPVIGDIEPLLPRERGEYPYTGALGLTAGISEELFFRLALPLLAYHATGSALLAFGIAGVTFGLMHWYQGWQGVAATMLVGAFLAYLYLSTGSLVKPVIVHVAIDLMALVVRPAVAACSAARAGKGVQSPREPAMVAASGQEG